jgi:AbiJ-like protein
LEKIQCRAGGLILGGLIDTCSKVHDNARKYGIKESEGCRDKPLLNDVASQLTFIAKCPELMKTFSERKGLKPVSEIIQIDSMSEALRNSLWNALDVALWSTADFIYRDYSEPHIQPLSRSRVAVKRCVNEVQAAVLSG